MSMANEAKKNTKTDIIKNLEKLIDEYKNLREETNKTSKIENDVYRDILDKIEEIILGFRELDGYDVQTFEDIISPFQDIKKRYYDKFGSRIDKGLRDIKNTSKQESLNDTIRLEFGKEEVEGLSINVGKLGNDIDGFLDDVDKIIKLFVKEYNIIDEPSTAIIESPVNKPNLISQIVYIVKRLIAAFKGKNEENDNGDNIIDVDSKDVQTISSKYKGYMTKKNQLDVCYEIKDIVDNDELINGLDQWFASEFERNVNKIEYFYGEIYGKKYIAFEDLKIGWPFNGDVVIFIDSRCLAIIYNYSRDNFRKKDFCIDYKEIIFDDEKTNFRRTQYYFTDQDYYIDFDDGIKIDYDMEDITGSNSRFEYRIIKNDNTYYKLNIENEKGQYDIRYEFGRSFLRKELPVEIDYLDSKFENRKVFVKKENSDKYNLCSLGRTEKSIERDSYVFDSEKEYSLEEVLKQIGIQLPDGAESIVDICPKPFIEAVSKHFEIIPEEARQIYLLLNKKAILKKLESIEKNDIERRRLEDKKSKEPELIENIEGQQNKEKTERFRTNLIIPNTMDAQDFYGSNNR